MAGRTDANQAAIVAAARQMGASVACTHMVKDGFPDLCVAWRGHTLLVEVKTATGRLTEDQIVWQDEWRAPVHIVRSPEEMIALLQAICCRCGERAEYMHPGRWRCRRCGEVWNG